MIMEILFPEGVTPTRCGLLVKSALEVFEDHWTKSDGQFVSVHVQNTLDLQQQTALNDALMSKRPNNQPNVYLTWCLGSLTLMKILLDPPRKARRFSYIAIPSLSRLVALFLKTPLMSCHRRVQSLMAPEPVMK